MTMQTKLILEDGTSVAGKSFGAKIETKGEVVFNTGMVGYVEGITDPSYKGQILILTYPLIGNYGVPSKSKDRYNILKHFESNRIQVSGLIVSDYSKNYNHYQAKKSLSQWMEKENVPGLTGVDTRELTKKIREKGTMLGAIGQKNPEEFYDPNLENLVSRVSIKKPVIYGKGKKTVIMVDCGVKLNIIRSIVRRGYRVILVPWDYDFLNTRYKYDAVFLTNGPGDPTMVGPLVERIKKAMSKNIPVIGICLGNQIIALAAGAKTYKLKYGHRSQNQPCVELDTNKCYLTTQNHGFNIREKSIPADWEVWFRNANDKTVEGIRHKSKPFASVQFHPEAAPGPTDTNFVFDKLLTLI